MALYSATNGPSWPNQTGWAAAAAGEACDPCDFNGSPWYGIFCDQGRVACVDLDGDPNCAPNNNVGNGLVGTIPQAFFELDAVQCISLAGQGITGELPEDYTGVPSVKCFSFANTNLQGEIPLGVSAMTDIRQFLLEDGDFSGPFPEGLRDMNEMQILRITHSELSGPIPAWVGDLDRLVRIFLQNNDLTGEIPPEMGQLDSLRTFFLQDNDLEGFIPEELAQMVSLREIALNRNRLSGDIPLGIFDISELQWVYLYGNELTGDIGEILSRVDGLRSLYLDGNNLTGCYELNAELCQISEVTALGGGTTYDGEFYSFYNENGYNFRNNDGLPLEGSYAAFCDGEEQAGSSCDDGNPLTENDVITIDCGCEGQLINTLPITLTISEAEATAGEEIVINFRADTLDALAGFQFGFTYEPELLEFLSISDNLAGPDVNVNSLIAGEVSTNWTSFGPGVFGSDVDLFSATFLVLDTCSSQVAIDTSVMPVEFTLESGIISDVDYSDTGTINGNRNCCSDGIQNGSETGVDCGGTNCTPCECEDTDLVIFNGNIIPAFCSAANGSATVIIMGGVPPYEFEWSNGATTAVNDNLLPGDYFVTVTDARGCSVTNSGNPARILDNAPIMPVCPDDLFFTVDANADSLLFDVVPPAIGDCTDEGLSYQVTGATDLSGQGIPEALILNLGTSMLTFTTGLDSCSYSVTVVQSTVDCSDLLIISLEARTALCYGDSSGLINVDLAGGSGNYEIQWSTGQTVEDLQDLEPGVYVLDLLDVDTECTVTAGFWLQSPDSIQIECVVVDGETVTNALITFSGAVLPVTLELSGTTEGRVEDLAATDYEFTDLTPGSYEVILTDANGCQAFCSFEIFAEPDDCENPANQPIVMLDPLNSYVVCPGQSTELVLLLENNQIVEWRAEPDGFTVGTESSLTVTTATTYSFSIFDTITGCAIDSFVTIMPDQRMPEVVCPADTTVLLNMGQFTSVTVSSGVPELVFAPCNDITFAPAEDLQLTETDTYIWQYQSANGQGGSCDRTINVIATDTTTIYVDEPNIYRRGTDTLMIPIAIRNWSNVESFIFDLEATDQTAGGMLVPIALAPNPAFADGIEIELLSPTRISVTWTSAPGEMDVPSDFRLLELPLVVTGNPGDCVNLHFGTSLDNAATAMMEGQQIYLSTVDGLACLPLVGSMSGNVFRLLPDLTVTPLANVTLELQQQEEGSLTSLSLEDGRYLFEELPVNESYEIVPSLADDFRRGIDLLDVVLLRDIWLNYDNPVSITTPYQLIAADVFPDCQINFIDLTFEVQMMLGGIDSFPGNTPWRFIPSAFEFPEEYELCAPVFPESIVYAPLVEDEPLGDFIGVKTGDLSLNASSPLLEGTTEIEMDDQLFQAGDTVRVSRILGAGEVAAAIYYRYDLSALSYLPSYNQMNGKPFRLNYSNKAGEIDQVLIDAAGEDELVFIAMKDGRLSRALFLREGSQVASLDHRFNALKLRWKDVALAAKGIEFSVYPNPFSDRLFIRFESFLNAAAQLTVRDLTGRTLFQTRLAAGTDRYVLETGANNLPPGVYLVTVENGLLAQRKLVVGE